MPATKKNRTRNSLAPSVRVANPAPTAWPQTTFLSAALLLLTVVIFWPARAFEFINLDDPAYVKAFAAFVRSHRRVKFIGFYNGRTGGRLDIGKHPRSLAAYRRFIVPLTR